MLLTRGQIRAQQDGARDGHVEPHPPADADEASCYMAAWLDATTVALDWADHDRADARAWLRSVVCCSPLERVA